MKKFRTCLLALCCCLLLSAALIPATTAETAENCPGSCVHAAAIGTTHYDTLEEALSAAVDGNRVKLLQDVTSNNLTVNKAITLDLGGKTITGTNAASDALLTVNKDMTVTGGTITTNAGAIMLATDCAVTIDKTATLSANMDSAALILYGETANTSATIRGKLSANGIQPTIGTTASIEGNITLQIEDTAVITSDKQSAIWMMEKGKLLINGGTFTAKESAIVMEIGDEMAMEATINGGNFTVDGDPISITTGNNSTAPKDFVLGGTYNKLPTAYIPSNCRTTDNGDGTFTVTATYSITVSAGGGSGSMAPIKADRDATITLPKCTLTAPSGKHFKAWQIGDKTYAPGASYTITGDLTMTAVWEAHKGGTATCSQKATCSVCGKSYGNTGSHKLTTSNGYAATCTSGGMIAHSKCSSCGQYFVNGNVAVAASSLTLPALGHDMLTVDGMEATCTEEGLLAHEKCDICGILYADGKEITEEDLVLPAAGHALEQVPAVEATCVQAGVLAHQKCTQCGILFVNDAEVTAEALAVNTAAHILSDWEQDASTHWKSCTVCGEIFRQHSHTYADNICDECGYEQPAAQPATEQKESDSFSPLFLIPIAVAVVIGAAVAIKAAKKKSN